MAVGSFVEETAAELLPRRRRIAESRMMRKRRLVRVLLWLAAPAKISRFYLGLLSLSYAVALLGWWGVIPK